MVDLSNTIGSVQSGIRPALIVQNNIGNRYSPTTIIAPLTSKVKNPMPTHMELSTGDGVTIPSTVLFEQTMVVDKSQLIRCLGKVENKQKILDMNQKIINSMVEE